jgi:PAS domain S-box-containing protein
MEIERHKHDGTSIPCIITTSPLKDTFGNTKSVIEQFRDITEKQQLEEKVEESEDRYRAMIEVGTEAGEAIVMLQDIDGKEGIQTFVSDQWPRMTGYAKEELLGSCFFDFLDMEDRQGSIDRHRSKMSGIPVPGHHVMQIIKQDKSRLIIEITGAFTIYQGKRAT